MLDSKSVKIAAYILWVSAIGLAILILCKGHHAGYLFIPAMIMLGGGLFYLIAIHDKLLDKWYDKQLKKL